MRKILTISLVLIFNGVVLAQKAGSIKGVVYDTITRQAVSDATITVLQQKDSSLVSFTMSNSSGEFSVSGIEPGNYRLLITHVAYHNSNKYFSISDSASDIDMGNLILNDKSKVLEEVVVIAEAPPVTLVGDTVQYNAGSFKTKPNSVVEDLLRKLPGVQVEKDGTVKAQGQTVNRVLVDGKEFFGTDPKVATKNLPADAVDKVQVYDRQSDMAQLTGFDDGNSEKTINLKLKKDKKKGLFGKVSAGGGTDERYQGRFNVNSFKGARHFSALGMGNNTNAEGFSFMDILGFSGALNQAGKGGGEINITLSADDPAAALLGGSNNNSINTTWAGGINYNNIIGTKMELNGSYFYSRYNPVTDTRRSRQYILPDSTYFSNQQSRTNNRSITNRANFTYDFLIDSMHSLKITPNFSYQSSVYRSRSDYETLSEELQKTNSGFSDSYSSGEGFNFSNNLLFRKKFKRKGRTLSFNLGTTINESDANSSLESMNEFFTKSGSTLLTDTINQISNVSRDSRGYNARVSYTEPLFRKSLMEFSVGKTENLSISDKETYDYNNGNGKYDQLNPFLTNNFENSYGTNTAGLRLRTQKKNFNYTVGLTWQNAELEGTVKSGIKDSVINKSFNNLLPNGRFEYKFNRFKSIRINYQAVTTQPTISQLQPVPDISDPLNIREGNPNLKQEYSHRINAMYTGVNPFRAKNLFIFTNFSSSSNKIVNYDVIDSLGRKRTTPVNVDGVYNLSTDIRVGFPLKFIKWNMNLNTRFSYGKMIQYINSERNDIRNTRIDPQVQLSKNFKDKLDLSFSAGLNIYNAQYSLQSALNNKYLTQEYSVDLGWQLPGNLFLSTDFDYRISSERAEGYNAKVPLWNASISKLFLKFDRGELKLSVFDLLNKNQGIVRNTNQNYIEDQVNRVLNRFFLLSFTYSLNKMSAIEEKRGGVIFKR